MIIGLTGPICAGTDTLAEILQKEFGFLWIAYSDILRGELKKRNVELTRKNLQDIGDELRKNEGNGVLSKRIIEQIKFGENYVIGNIRNPGEVEVMREKYAGKFMLVKIDASQELRFQRLLQRRREKDPQTFEEFKKVEERDFGENEESYGQQHNAVFALADKVIENNLTLEELRDKVKKLVEELDIKH